MNDMKFAENIRNLRKNKGLSLEELGKKLGKAKSSISAWENGKRTPKIGEMQKIADFFGVTKSQLLGLEDYEEINEHNSSLHQGNLEISLPLGEETGTPLSVLGIPVLTDNPALFREYEEYIKENLIKNIDVFMKKSRTKTEEIYREEGLSEDVIKSLIGIKMSDLSIENQEKLAQTCVNKITVEKDKITFHYTF